MNLSDRVINAKRSDPAGRNRYIYANNRLNALPTGGLFALLKKNPLLGKSVLGVAYSEMRKPGSDEMRGKDESIHSFVSRRLGEQVNTNTVCDPFKKYQLKPVKF